MNDEAVPQAGDRARVSEVKATAPWTVAPGPNLASALVVACLLPVLYRIVVAPPRGFWPTVVVVLVITAAVSGLLHLRGVPRALALGAAVVGTGTCAAVVVTWSLAGLLERDTVAWLVLVPTTVVAVLLAPVVAGWPETPAGAARAGVAVLLLGLFFVGGSQGPVGDHLQEGDRRATWVAELEQAGLSGHDYTWDGWEVEFLGTHESATWDRARVGTGYSVRLSQPSRGPEGSPSFDVVVEIEDPCRKAGEPYGPTCTEHDGWTEVVDRRDTLVFDGNGPYRTVRIDEDAPTAEEVGEWLAATPPVSLWQMVGTSRS